MFAEFQELSGGQQKPGRKRRSRQMTEEQARQVHETAKSNRMLSGPVSLIEAWKASHSRNSLPQFLADLRRLIKDEDLNDPRYMELHVAIFIEMMVVRFERLVDSGAFDSALPRLTALPMLYSPRAGKGAPGWERARKKYDEKRVGSAGLVEYRGHNPAASRTPIWGELAEMSVRVAWIAAGQFEEFRAQREEATGYRTFKFKRGTSTKAVCSTLFALRDGKALVWPEWLEKCRGLPKRAVDDIGAYKKAVGALLSSFFYDPMNPCADDVLRPLMQSTSGYSRAEAVKQATKDILRCVGRR